MANLFIPVYGEEQDFNKLPIENGRIYFSTDTRKIFVDMNDQRIPMGGSGISLFYADQTNVIKSDDETSILFSEYFLDQNSLPQINDIIINSDGIFYRVKEIDNEYYTCSIIAISGTSGGGGGTSPIENDLELTISGIKQNQNFIYGQDAEITVSGLSKKDDGFYLSFDLYDRTDLNNQIFLQSFKTEYISNGMDYTFNLKELFTELGTKRALLITISSDNASKPLTRSVTNLSIVRMEIKKPQGADITAPIRIGSSSSCSVSYIPIGDKNSGLVERLHVYIDSVELELDKKDYEIKPAYYGRSVSINIREQSHGLHIIELAISTELDNITIFTDRISYEIAWIDMNSTLPVIWVGEYSKNITQYDVLQIPFLFYHPQKDPQNLESKIELYQNNTRVSTLELSFSSPKINNWFIFDVTDYYTIGKNNFSIKCENVVHEIDFYVNPSDIDLTLAKSNNLMMNFSTIGRSSLETKNIRPIFQSNTSNTYQADLKNFNWQNNGWQDDNDGNGSYLNVANGASVEIPIPAITLNSDTDYTLEMRFRIKNVQEYSTLIKEVETYFYKVEDPETGEFKKSSSGKTRTEIIAEHGQDSFSNWVWLDEYGSPEVDPSTSIKEIQRDAGVACTWLNNSGQGMAIGTHESYFTDLVNTASIKFIEDEIVNISIIISKSSKLIYFYLNGILSGGALLPTGITGSININSKLLINSNYCDFDLFNFRIYATELTMPDVIHNYIADLKDITIYNQNQLTDDLDPTSLSYEKLVEYNASHPEAPTMPYAVFEIMKKDDKGRETLPYYKGDNRVCKVTFINPCADQALLKGEIDEKYYYTHAPSFESYGVDINVQGTSSQGYARRNYKTKFKDSYSKPDKYPDYYWKYLKGSLAGKSLGDKATIIDPLTNVSFNLSSKFHMDNETYGTDKFTWKIDYMESSGMYNTGFANLMGNKQHAIYKKHPLADLNIPGLNTEDLRTTIYGFPVLTFQKFADGTYQYIGRYNMNLDKGSDEYYGFKLKNEHPYVPGKTIAEVAESWELEDNDGTWCSFRYPTQSARTAGFKTLQSGYTDRLEILKHFEYRYSNYGDQLDWIGPDGKYDGVIAETDQEIIDEVGETNLQKSEYAYNVYRNLEKVFNWLDSTDTINATNEILPEQVTYITQNDYSQKTSADGETIEQDTSSVLNENSTYTTTFSRDTAGYRLEKFRNEFDFHFDKDYCIKYFILTELLLCYDSRGKNMMMTTFGPHELNGEYVWYPTFYDIDTQLGLNNSGFYLWDYDADVTENGLFSTPNSVLWGNLYKAFNEVIISEYNALRLGGSDASSNIKLTYDSILGAYECNPEVFDSYAMRGIRPIVAIGLDAYYKYLAPANPSKGYYTTKGELKTQSPPYKVFQGDKKMSTAALLQNRLNYIDSWWITGNYHSTKIKDGIELRLNGNYSGATSDKYLDTSVGAVPSEFEKKSYPVEYYDSLGGFYIKPFLKQYIYAYHDENPTPQVKYDQNILDENGIFVPFSEGDTASIKTSVKWQQQLFYIPEFDMISSLGDLSRNYLDRATVHAGKKLLDFNIGSDIPGYFNQLFTDLEFDDSKDMATKPLLQSMNLCRLTNFSESIDLQGSKKLQEFRALNTNLQGVSIAYGAPISILHLPNTIGRLELVSTKNLNKILFNEPQIVYPDPNHDGMYLRNNKEFYTGLYLKGITDYTNDLKGQGHNLNALVLEDTNLNYGTYIILRNLWDLKKTATINNELKASLKNVNWSPYEQVESNTLYSQKADVPYFYLTPHNVFESYIPENETQWNIDVNSGYIYTYNSDLEEDSQIITNLDLLKDLIENNCNKFNLDGTKNKNIFISVTADGSQPSVPSITGELYINNSKDEDNPIDEIELDTIYKRYWPELKIYAAKINTCPIIKFVDFNNEDEKENLIELIRYESFDGRYSNIIPSRLHQDFLGWSLENNNQDRIIISYDNDTKELTPTDEFNSLDFNNAENNIITLYAIFTIHKYNIKFLNPDDSELITIQANAGTKLTNPNVYCGYDSESLDANKRYEFAGWTTQKNNTIASSLVNARQRIVELSDYTSLQDYIFYACYYPVSVYDSPTSIDYFNCNDSGNLSPKSGYILSGKVTIPTFYNGRIVKKISGFQNSKITHLFFQQNSQVEEIIDNCFRENQYLTYIECPNSLKTIGQYAFYQNYKLKKLILNEGLIEVKTKAFNMSFAEGTIELIIPGSLKALTDDCFTFLKANISGVKEGKNVELVSLTIGSNVSPANIPINTEAFKQNGKWENITVYSISSKADAYQQWASSYGKNVSTPITNN